MFIIQLAVNSIFKNVLATVLVALTLSLILGVETSKALEALKVYRGVLILEGKIVAGDDLKLRDFLSTKSNFDKISGGVFLASPGGSVEEAMKIGRLIRALRLSTDAPLGATMGHVKFGEPLIKPSHLVDPKENYLCASACFLVYVSGIYRNLYEVGRLGVHRPLRLESSFMTLSDDEALYAESLNRKRVENYLNQMNVPEKYVDLMFSVPHNDIRWITQDEFVSDLQGFIPEVRDLIDAKCDPRSNKGKFNFETLKTKSARLENGRLPEQQKIVSVPTKQPGEIARCQIRVKTELSAEAWHKVFGDK